MRVVHVSWCAVLHQGGELLQRTSRSALTNSCAHARCGVSMWSLWIYAVNSVDCLYDFIHTV